MRIALIGCGPKGLAALVELEKALNATGLDSSGLNPTGLNPAKRVAVDVYEQHSLGSGAVWSTNLPPELLMNVSPRIVDMSCPSFPWNYVQWAEQQGIEPAQRLLLSGNSVAQQEYPPRRIMGRYLEAAATALLNSELIEVTHFRQRVTDLTLTDDGWRVEVSLPDSVGDELETPGAGEAQGAGEGQLASKASLADGSQQTPHDGPLYQSVLIATGHEEPLSHADIELVRNPQTGPSAHSHVRIRGAALTALDWVLTLTEGRGGRFAPSPRADRMTDFTYEPVGLEPRSITLVSRSNVPMSPKPTNVSPTLVHLIGEATGSLVPLNSGALLPNNLWWEALLESAWNVAEVMGYHASKDSLRRTLFAQDTCDSTLSVLERMEQHMSMNHGLVEPSEEWIWGRVWNIGYTNIISSLDRATRDSYHFRKFHSVAATMERWAFGPPEKSVAKLLALSKVGVVRWEKVGPTVIPVGAHRQVNEEELTDVFEIDSVTKRPGVMDPDTHRVDSDLWTKLLRSKAVHVRPNERGIITTTDTQCLGPSGNPTQGLYCIGRPTEDPVIGNDTLNHALHDEAQRWAQHMVATWEANSLVSTTQEPK